MKESNTQHNEKPIITSAWEKAVISSNLSVGLAEIASAGTETMSVAVDGLHNLGDTASYWFQTQNILDRNISKEKRDKRRKLVYGIIFASSLLASGKSVVDLESNKDAKQNQNVIYPAASSVILNSSLFISLAIRIRRKSKEYILSHHDLDLIKHSILDSTSSVLALSGTILQQADFSKAENIAALTSGLLGAYMFRPTNKNLHNH